MTKEELVKLKIPQLKPIAKAFNRKVSTLKKADLINEILKGPSVLKQKGTEMDEIVKCWFMKPLPKTDAIKIGSTNESSVLGAVVTYHQTCHHLLFTMALWN